MGKLYSEMIFVHGYVHCDPHPGNVLVNKTKQGNTEIVLLDHGLYQVCCSPPSREYSTVVNKIKKDETEITLLDHVLCQICLGFTLGISDIGGSHWWNVVFNRTKQGLSYIVIHWIIICIQYVLTSSAELNRTTLWKDILNSDGQQIPTISTRQTITSYLNSLNIKKTTTYDIRNPSPGLGQAQKCGGVKLVNEIPPPIMFH